jgi:Holliday junction resolvase
MNALKKLGWFVVKIHGGQFQMPGIPDVLAIKDGVHAWGEFKSTHGRLRPVQEVVIARLRKAGANVWIGTTGFVQYAEGLIDGASAKEE